MDQDMTEFETGYLGTLPMYVPIASFIANYLRNNVAYEPHLASLMLGYLNQGSVFVDVGANVGYFSVQAAKLVGQDGKVISVEPDPRNALCLVKTRAMNGFQRQWQIVPVAASEDLACEAILLDNASNSSTRDLDVVETTDFQLALGLPLDIILAREAKVDVIKIDIEAREYKAMRGAAQTLVRHRPIIFSEFHPAAMPGVAGNTGKEYLDLLFGLGYQASIIKIDESGLEPCGQNYDSVMRGVDDPILSSRGMRHLDLLFEPIRT